MRLMPAPTAELPAPRPQPVQVGVLGPLALTVGGRSVPPPAGRQRRLLSILAVQSGPSSGAGIEDLVEAVYGQDAVPRARHSLATELWRLRQVVGAGAVRIGDLGYHLDPDLVDVDVARFTRLLADGRAALDRRAYREAAAATSRALAMWRGQPLVDLADHPVGQAERARLEELRLGGLEDQAEALGGVGDAERALELLARVTADHPAREHAWALLVESALRCGQPRRARQAFDSARRVLAEHGVDLGTELLAAQDLLRERAPGVRRPGGAPGGAPGPARPTLVGREAEVEQVRRAVDAALAGSSPAVVLVTGEPGIGKTALAEHVAAGSARARPGTVVTRITGDRRLQLPYAVLRPALRQLAGCVPTVPALLTDLLAGTVPAAPTDAAASGRIAIREAIADLVESAAVASGGLIVLVDDAQWASTESIESLLHLVARRAGAPLCVLATVRPPGADGETTRPLLAELRRRATEVVALAGLDVDATRQLLGAGADDAAARRAHRLTGGNPLYLRQWLSAGGAAGARRPSSLDDAIDEHLATLPREVVDLLRFTAVGGTRVDGCVLVAAAAHPPLALHPDAVADALEAAVRAGLVQSDPAHPGEVAFVHVLVRDRLYDGIPAGGRAAAHALFADAVEHLVDGTAGAAVELVAHHASRAWPACPTATVVARLRDAGRHAAAQLGFDRALVHYRRALDLVGMDPGAVAPGEVADLLEAAAQSAAAAAGGHDEVPSAPAIAQARAAYAAMGALAARHDLVGAQLRAGLGEVRSFSLERIDEAAVDRLETALDVCAGDPGRHDLTAGLVGEALAALCTYRPGRAWQLRGRIVDGAPEWSGPIGTAMWDRQGVPARLVTAERLVRDPTADPVGAWVRLWASEVTAGRRSFLDPPPLAVPLEEGSEQARWELSAWHVTAAIASGRFARADRLLRAAGAQVRTGASASQVATRAAAMMGQRIRLTLLRAEGPLTAPDVEAPHTTWVTTLPVMRSWSAYFAAVTGRRELASQMCSDLTEDLAEGLVAEADLLPWALAAATAAVEVGHRRCIAACRELLVPHAGHHGLYTLTAYWGAVDHHRGRLAVADGELDEGIADLAESVGQYRQVGAEAYEARALHDLACARWQRDRGEDRQQAASDRQGALALARELGVGGVTAAAWPPSSPSG